MSELALEMQQQNDAVIVKMAGDAAVGSVAEIERLFLRIQAMHPRLVVLDLTALDFIASIGMGTLVSLKRAVERSGGSVRLAGVNDNVMAALQRSRLDQAFEIHDTPDAALA